MKFYISTTGTTTKRVTISGAGICNEMKGKKLVARRFTQRSVMLPALLLFGFLLLRTALMFIESANLCSSSIECMTWRFFGGRDAMLREELTRALLEATTSSSEDKDGGSYSNSNSESNSFKDLVKDMATNKKDIKAFAFKTKAMMTKMEHTVKRAKWHEFMYWHLAGRGVPKSLQCLTLKLAEEYTVNAVARARLPLPQYIYHLTDPSLHHIVLLTDNVLAASAVISSTIENSIDSQKLVFHLVTNKKTYASMHAWFALNKIDSAVIEVKGLHQYNWSHEVNVSIKEMLEIHHQIWNHKYKNLKKENFVYEEAHDHTLDVLSPSCANLLNHLRIYLPELFPDLDRVLFLDDDVVVQHDLSPLWDIDLNQKVVGAVVDSGCGLDCCPGRKYKDYFNFTIPIISSNLNRDHCGWLYGMNVFDLKLWRETNITAIYHEWLKNNLNSGFAMWHPGALPPALIAFNGYVHRLDPSWHIAGLGYRYPNIDKQKVEDAAVIHYSGPAKPWLEIGSPEVRGLWNRHVNFSSEYIRQCGIMG